MNPAFLTFLSAAAEDRRDAFLGAAPGGPRLLFKGGTSLSKAFGLISRFSEDIDITIFRDDLSQGASVEELEKLSGKKRPVRLDAIKAARQAYVNEPMRQRVAVQLHEALQDAGLQPTAARIELDPDDQDQQSLLIWCPQVTSAADAYVRPAVMMRHRPRHAPTPGPPCAESRPTAGSGSRRGPSAARARLRRLPSRDVGLRGLDIAELEGADLSAPEQGLDMGVDPAAVHRQRGGFDGPPACGIGSTRRS